jgi:hypothetical protein
MILHELPPSHVSNVRNTMPLVSRNIMNKVDMEYHNEVSVKGLEWDEAEKLSSMGIVMGIQRAEESELSNIRAELDQLARSLQPSLQPKLNTLQQHIADTGGY